VQVRAHIAGYVKNDAAAPNRRSELVAASEEHEVMDPRTDAEVIVCSFESPASFGELFDRHATTMFRYFVRRVGPDDADSLLGELFRIAFEKRAGFDPVSVAAAQ
jgi:hypothetical protein